MFDLFLTSIIGAYVEVGKYIKYIIHATYLLLAVAFVGLVFPYLPNLNYFTLYQIHLILFINCFCIFSC